MTLSGQQRKELQDAIIDAFPDIAFLERMLAYELDKNLRVIAGEGGLQDIVFKLIQAANAQGWVEDLILAARKSNNGNLRLKAIAEELLIPRTLSDSTAPSPESPKKQTQRNREINKKIKIPKSIIITIAVIGGLSGSIGISSIVTNYLPQNTSTQPFTQSEVEILNGYDIRIYFPKDRADLETEANDLKRLFSQNESKVSISLHKEDTSFFQTYNYPNKKPSANEIRYIQENTNASEHLKKILKLRYPSKEFYLLPIGSVSGKYVTILLGP